ncbi:MAG: TonB family protein [Candidatus Omnitrophota bacterium]|nr:TonB family protein [Candidatus Omnitrophota bacterium]
MLKFTFLLFFILSAAGAYAEELKLITLYVTEIKVFPVNTPTKIVINNPNILDVTAVSKGDMILVAKSPGATNLVWWDAAGQHTLQVEVFQEDMNLIKKRIDALLKELNFPKVFTRPSDSEGKVLLLGSVKTPSDLERIDVALSSLKGKTTNLIQLMEERAVVEINVQVLELNKDASKALGFTFPGALNLMEVGSPGISAAGTKFSTLFKVLNLQRGTSAGADPFTFKLDALIQEGKARILSQPRLACQSGKEAELLVGGEKPVFNTSIAASTGASGTNIEYKEYGIKLKIKPTITEDKQIKLALNVEVSDVGVAETIGSTGGSTTTTTAKAYPLTKRSASTQLFLNDGQMMAIGGLIKQKSEEDIRKTPFLGDIPVLGVFFRKKTATSGGGTGERGDTELVITLTPTIIKEPALVKVEKTPLPLPVAAKVPLIRESAKIEAPLPGKTKVISSAELTRQAMSEYMLRITKRIQDNLVYPWAAKQGQMQGLVRLDLLLNSMGALLEVKVKQSSGYSIFDEDAVSMVKKISPYPPFPAELNQKELRVVIPIVYKLE